MKSSIKYFVFLPSVLKLISAQNFKKKHSSINFCRYSCLYGKQQKVKIIKTKKTYHNTMLKEPKHKSRNLAHIQ